MPATVRAKLHPRQVRLVEAVQAEFDRLKRDIRMDSLPHEVSDEERNLIVAQNALRTCLEATLERLLPYSASTPCDLAIRLASYCISALPVEAQDNAVDVVRDLLPLAHRQRLAQGVRLDATWDTPGEGERSPFPVAS